MEVEKGICRMSLVPMRCDPEDGAAMVSQILFGEHYSVINKNGTWLQVQLHFDKSEGWIRKDQHEVISAEYFEQINNSDYKVCTDLSSNIFFKKKHVNILLGSILPISTNELFKIEEQVAFNGSSKSLNQKREFEFFKEILASYMYAPYLPGGKSPFGVDESGFIQQVFKISGYKLGRTLAQQMKQGTEVDKLDNATQGDVVIVGRGQPTSAFVMCSGAEYIGVYDGMVQKIDGTLLNGNILGIRRILHPHK
ncbi:MAG: NlpC/P60 family protein [Cyclobacteriaceae bacterium]